ncbi:MAG: hypothetical protein ACETVQ_03730, partial [Candidatus Bathyarchaeia archaeon]
WLNRLPGYAGIGNVRYTTSGGTDEQSLIRGTQPFLIETEKAKLAVAFNGNIVNHFKLRNQLKESFPESCYECDLELVGRKLVMELAKNGDLASSVKSCMNEIEGAFSVVGLTKNGELFAFKDPYGIKPLCCGHSPDGTIHAVSSETVGLNINGFDYDFELKPGEFVIASKEGFIREQLVPCRKRALCAFEFAYFARPDSRLGNKFVYEIREEFGRNLAKEYSEFVKDADVIISLPETGDDVALGLHEATGLRWERAVRRHRYVTERAFILLPEERYASELGDWGDGQEWDRSDDPTYKPTLYIESQYKQQSEGQLMMIYLLGATAIALAAVTLFLILNRRAKFVGQPIA